MTLAQLQIFLTLIETQSFTKTGEILGMSQSAVSHAIASLESEFGVPLIVREKRNSLSLSSAGERLTVHIREIMRRVGFMMEELAFLKGMEAGSIRIGSSPAASTQLLPRVLAAFHEQHRDIEVVLVEGTTAEVLGWVATQAVDVGLVGSLTPPENGTTLFRDPLVVLLPRSFACHDEQVISIEALRNKPFVMTKSDYGALIQEVLHSHGINPDVKHEVGDALAALAMVQAGIGITVIPESLGGTANLSKVQVRRLDPMVSLAFCLTTRAQAETSPSVRAFTELAKSISNLD